MFTDEDDKTLEDIEKKLQGYEEVMAQANTNPAIVASPEASTSTTIDTVRQGASMDDAAQQQATREDVARRALAEPDVAGAGATGQQLTARTPGPETTHGSALQSLSKNGKVKEEPQEESRVSTNRLVDDLHMAWDVDIDDRHVEPSLQNQDKEAFGHMMRNSQTRYCVRYGSADAYSARFESTIPNGSRYRETRDVTQRSNRIVERIVQHHRDKKQALPMDILSKVKVLVVYWDSKMGIGHAAEVDVLAPDFAQRRPHTRCFIYLDPELYASKYDIENKTGYSHETRSTIKLLMEGNDDWQKSTSLYNIAVRLENKFEERCMNGVPGRPGPLRELLHERTEASRRSRSRYATAELAASPTPVKPRMSPRLSTPLPEMRLEQTPTRIESGRSLKQRFHADFIELFDLAEDATYEDLTEPQKLLYPAQFTKWKAINA
ncbi:hypothetical protein J4E91_011140 [Alternaria rosae]|nr:hypothetical protein J4E91_011140 [Alternaria rosae]